jgi:hypothetical protein
VKSCANSRRDRHFPAPYRIAARPKALLDKASSGTRRIRFNAGEVGGVSYSSRTSRVESMDVCHPMTNFQKKVSPSVDSHFLKIGTLVIVEGDFQGMKYNQPHLANCQVTEVKP